MNTRYNYLIFLLTAILIASCGSEKTENTDTEITTNEVITISKSQFESSGMELGKPIKMNFTESIRANGNVVAAPSGMAQISSLLAGKIKRIAVNVGDQVSKGQILCTIESTEFIRLQQDFAEATGMLKASRAEFERQKLLAGDNIASQKIFLNAESDYKSLLAKVEGQKAILLLLGQNIEKVSQGAIQSDLNLFAPIAGYVANLQAETGAFAEPQKVIMELVDLNQLQLKLSVFEREMTGLKPGLKINFYSPNNTNEIFTGQVVSYSRAIDPETKAIAVIGSIQQSEKAKLISGMYLEAEIFTGEREVMALPDEAILKSGETRLVIVRTSNDANEMKFITKEVQTGSNSNGFTEILNPEGLDNVLIKGGFNLVME